MYIHEQYIRTKHTYIHICVHISKPVRNLALFLMSSFSISSGRPTLYGTKDSLVDHDFNWHCYNNFNNHQKVRLYR